MPPKSYSYVIIIIIIRTVYLRPVYTGAFLTHVHTVVEKCTFTYSPYIRAVFMGSTYRALVMFVKWLQCCLQFLGCGLGGNVTFLLFFAASKREIALRVLTNR